MNKKIKKKKGAALITAILLASIVGAVAIGVSAIAIRQVNISETYSNGLVAFYSAESGLEEGLLRFRFDKNAQIPASMGGGTTDSLERVPRNKYRSDLEREPMNTYPISSPGTGTFYQLIGRNQIYDLQTYYQQKFYGDDVNNDDQISVADFRNLSRPNNDYYLVAKDEQKDFTITGSDHPSTSNRIYLYWKWMSNCPAGNPKGRGRALEVKLKVDTTAAGLPSDRDQYTALFRDTTCGPAIANSDVPVIVASNPTVFTAVGGGADLKSKMNILSLPVVSMSIKPVGGDNNDVVGFGFYQDDASGRTKVAGPTTTVKSLGYFAGVTNQLTAEIDRQTGTVLDLFNYVIYKGQ